MSKKNKSRGLSGLWALVLLALLIPDAIGTAYRIITVQGEITVEESIIVIPESFAIVMYPGEIHDEVITLTNISPVDLTVTPAYTVPIGLDVTGGSSVTVPANGSVNLTLNIAARTDIEPGLYTVDVGVYR